MGTQLWSNRVHSWAGHWRELWACNHVSARVFHSKFAPRKRIIVKGISAFSTRRDIGLRHCGCSELERSYDRFCGCFGQVCAAKGWTASAVDFCLTPYRLARTRLYDPRKHWRPIQAPAKVQRAMILRDSFDSTNFKNLEGFTSSKFPGEDALKAESAQRLWNHIFNSTV